MADDWDDWGDDDDEAAASDGGDNNSSSDKSEGWDWPVAATTKPPAPIGAAVPKQQSPEDESSAVEREAREAVVEEMTEKFFVELRSYLENLADPSVRQKINQELTKCDFASLTRYYDGRDDLATYTLDTELQRMRYAVVTEDGRRLGEDEREGVEPEQEGDGGGGGGGGASVVREFLAGRVGDAMLRMANQSIFADMLEAIQGRLLRPDLEISVISRDCEFFLDFSRGVLEARSLFEVSTVGGGGPGEPETLEMAQIKGTACVDTRTQTCTQRLLSPQLRMVFDDAMRASARVLALHSFMDRGAGMGEFETGVGVGGLSNSNSNSLRRMESLRDSLARASTDGMGRAAAAGTGLLANVVAGVGSAIGASRTGTLAGDPLYVGGDGGGSNSEGPKSTITDEAALVQLYRRADPAEEAGRAAPGAAATAAGSACTTTTTTTVAPDEGTPAINSFFHHGGAYSEADSSGVGAGSSSSSPLAGPHGGNGQHGAVAAGGGGGQQKGVPLWGWGAPPAEPALWGSGG
ncbi:unnamed protein product, partial [Ectocarpus fasciculatus]